MDGKFTEEEFKKARPSEQILMLYHALRYEKDFIREGLLGLAGDHLKAAKARKVIHDKVEKLGRDVANIKGSNYVLILVVVALIGVVVYTAG